MNYEKLPVAIVLMVVAIAAIFIYACWILLPFYVMGTNKRLDTTNLLLLDIRRELQQARFDRNSAKPSPPEASVFDRIQ